MGTLKGTASNLDPSFPRSENTGQREVSQRARKGISRQCALQSGGPKNIGSGTQNSNPVTFGLHCVLPACSAARFLFLSRNCCEAV